MQRTPASRLGYLLRKTRVELDINQGIMAKKLNISASYLSAIEKGKRRVTGDTANDIRAMLLKFHSSDEVEMAIMMSQSIIEFAMPQSEPKRELLVRLSQCISQLSDVKASDILSQLLIEMGSKEPLQNKAAMMTGAAVA
ncbi:helix-turn-helix domain-containing protein [Aeromonas sp. 23P]|uniref:helix-turn-helix domain-containing protein n=1 Tax=Aeromonas sp. 23P TaxID=3452716 RepID=UPI003F7956E2